MGQYTGGVQAAPVTAGGLPSGPLGGPKPISAEEFQRLVAANNSKTYAMYPGEEPKELENHEVDASIATVTGKPLPSTGSYVHTAGNTNGNTTTTTKEKKPKKKKSGGCC